MAILRWAILMVIILCWWRAGAETVLYNHCHQSRAMPQLLIWAVGRHDLSDIICRHKHLSQDIICHKHVNNNVSSTSSSGRGPRRYQQCENTELLLSNVRCREIYDGNKMHPFCSHHYVSDFDESLIFFVQVKNKKTFLTGCNSCFGIFPTRINCLSVFTRPAYLEDCDIWLFGIAESPEPSWWGSRIVPFVFRTVKPWQLHQPWLQLHVCVVVNI